MSMLCFNNVVTSQLTLFGGLLAFDVRMHLLLHVAASPSHTVACSGSGAAVVDSGTSFIIGAGNDITNINGWLGGYSDHNGDVYVFNVLYCSPFFSKPCVQHPWPQLCSSSICLPHKGFWGVLKEFIVVTNGFINVNKSCLNNFMLALYSNIEWCMNMDNFWLSGFDKYLYGMYILLLWSLLCIFRIRTIPTKLHTTIAFWKRAAGHLNKDL